MEIKVTKNNVTIQELDPVHSGEFNVNQCNFTFSETYTNDLVKKAIFTKLKYNASYEVTIQNDTCIIPYEVLKEQGEVQIGVYAYEVDGEDLVLRYSPKATRFMVGKGSYLNADDGTIKVPALTIEEYEQALNNLLQDVEASKEQIVEEITNEVEADIETAKNNAIDDIETALNNAIDDIENEAQDIITMNNKLLDQIPTGTAEGETINLTDSSNLPFKDFALEGNATQDGTPTPSTPVDIKVVTGDVTVNVLGDNLFNEALLSQEENYNTYNSSTGLWTTSDGGSYYRSILYPITGSSTNRNINKLIKMPLVGTYTAKIYDLTKNGNPGDISFALFDKNGEFISQVASSTNEATLTVTEPCYLDIRRVNSSGNYSFSKIQIEYGSTATPYTPYQAPQQVTLPLGDIELAKIGDYKDKIYKDNGKWYLYKEILKIELGEKNYSLVTSASYGDLFKASVSNVLRQYAYDYTYPYQAYCSNYPIVRRTASNFVDLTMTFDGGASAVTEIRFKNSNYTEAESFKNSMNGQVLYAPIATPTTTEITDTSLINALEQVLAMHTNKNVTNIYFEIEEDTAEPTGEFIYRKDLETMFNNLAGGNSVNANLLNTSSIQMNTGSLVGLGNTANSNIIDELYTDETSNLDVIDDNNSGDTI